MLRVLSFTAAVVIASLHPAFAQPILSSYRGLSLGDSVEQTMAKLEGGATDLKSVHEQPELVQRLTWRPFRFISGAMVAPDPLADMQLTFHRDRLVRIEVSYDRERVEGLTNADLHALLSEIYGTPLLPSGRPRVESTADPVETIGRWEDGSTLVVLLREGYPTRVSLTISSLAAARAMDASSAESVRRDALEAPVREAARQAAAAEAVRLRKEKIRLDNKATFKP